MSAPKNDINYQIGTSTFVFRLIATTAYPESSLREKDDDCFRCSESECASVRILHLNIRQRIELPATLNDENTNMRSTIKSPDAGKLVPKTADEIVKLEDQAQCFTPITKKILEKVSQDCTQGASNSSHSSTAKRNINFSTITIADLGNVAPELPDSQPATIVETPKKKNNGEEQNVQPA